MWKKDGYAVLILIDFSSAYDNVNRFKLFEKIKKLGFWDDEDINLLAFLYQHGTIQLNGTSGEIGKGVQQGSILAPSLFNLYIQELLDHLNFCPKFNGEVLAQAYADDTAIVTTEMRMKEAYLDFKNIA